MDEYNLDKAGKQLVVKSNDFIQQKKYDLSLAQQKILAYTISKIQPGETEFRPQRIGIAEFCELCGHAVPDYSYVKEVAKSLYQNCFWYDEDDNKSRLYSWVDNDMVIDYGDGTITLKLSDKLKPYLLNLKNNFTQYQLKNVLSLKSKYGVRLYELLKSYQNIDDNIVISVDKLRTLLMCEKTYPEFKSFNKYVLSRAIDDINKNTDLNVFSYPKRMGRKISSILFIVLKK